MSNIRWSKAQMKKIHRTYGIGMLLWKDKDSRKVSWFESDDIAVELIGGKVIHFKTWGEIQDYLEKLVSLYGLNID